MSMTIGNRKVLQTQIGENVIYNQKNEWLECTIGPKLTAQTPIIMHYDRETGVTTIVGWALIAEKWGTSDGRWAGELLTLPEGYEFTSVDKTFPVSFGNSTGKGTGVTVNGPTASGNFPWTFSDPSSGKISLGFGQLWTYATPTFWQTTTIRPIGG